MNYFAYGANMDLLTLAERDVDHLPLGPGRLDNCHLTFQMPGLDGTGKADIPPQHGSVVEGVVYRVSETGLQRLDLFEGVATGHYARALIKVVSSDGIVECVTYRAVRTRQGLHPSVDYLARLVRGAETHGLSAAYREFLRGHDTMPLPEA